MIALVLVGLMCTAMGVTVRYSPDDVFMANPERGYMRSSFVSTSGCDEPLDDGTCPTFPYESNPNCALEEGRYHCYEPLSLSSETLSPMDTSGPTESSPWRSTQPYRSVIWRIVYLNSAVSTLATIPNIILNGIANDFVQLQKAGFKAYYRFAYARNHPRPWSGESEYYTEPNDVNVIKKHASQLLGVINENRDLVVGVNLGFLGYYGEGHWWDETCNCPRTPRDPSWQNILIGHFLSTLDSSLALSVRVPSYKASYNVSWDPLDRNSPFTDNRRRVGLHNDCFLNDQTDAGTFARENAQSYTEGTNTLLAACGGTLWGASRFTSCGLSCDRDYFKNEAKYTHAMGETCGEGRASCTTFQNELRSYHFSLLNLDWSPAALGTADVTCHDVIRRSLGYRLEIKSARYVVSGRRGTLNVTLVNTGYTRLIKNKRLIAVIGGVTFQADTTSVASDFRSIDSNAVSYCIKVDTRKLHGENLPIYLGITDMGLSLRNNNKFNIRLASSIKWDSSTGLHDTGLIAKPTSKVTPYPTPIPSHCGITTRCIHLVSGNPNAIPKATPFSVTLYNLPVDRVGNSDYLVIDLWGVWIGDAVYTNGVSPFTTSFTTPDIPGTYRVHYYSPDSNRSEKALLILTVL